MNVRFPLRLVLSSAIIGLAVAAVPNEATAASITITDNLPDSMYVASGGVAAGRFDLSGVFNVTSASILFEFSDDGSDLSSWTNQYGPSYWTWSGSRHQNITPLATQYYNESESARVATAGQSASVAAPYFDSGYQWTGQYTHIRSEWWGSGWGAHWDDYYYTHYNHSFGYTGPFSVSMALTGVALADLAADGVLDFSVQATGDLMFEGATLFAQVEPLAPAAVPEPATLALLGTGLAGLIARRVRRGSAAVKPRTKDEHIE